VLDCTDVNVGADNGAKRDVIFRGNILNILQKEALARVPGELVFKSLSNL